VKSFTPFNPAQIDALIPLAKDIIARYHIAPQNVVAHADIAPQRKDDPGPLFRGAGWPSRGLAHGRMPARGLLSAGASVIRAGRRRRAAGRAGALRLSGDAGDDAAQQKRVIMAFQMHFRPRAGMGLPMRKPWR
jgi:N-acetylmuramoyl-L-alanine amidase